MSVDDAGVRLERPEDLLRHECITFCSRTTGALYAWELERGRKSFRVPVGGGVVTNDTALNVSMAEQGLGLACGFAPLVRSSCGLAIPRTSSD